ncbi:hypothetical protein [Empedobacter falsenii]
MKYIYYFLLLILPISIYSQRTEKITIPNGIKYKYADQEIIEKTKDMILSNLKDSLNYSMIDKKVFVGPHLWYKIQDKKGFKNIQDGNVYLIINNKPYLGKLLQRERDSKKMLNLLKSESKNNTITIRKLNEIELKYFWATISTEITEPILLVEIANKKYIMHFSEKDNKLIWIDQFPY